MASVESMAGAYGVEYYEDIDAMHADHPAQDVSDLVDQSAPSVEGASALNSRTMTVSGAFHGLGHYLAFDTTPLSFTRCAAKAGPVHGPLTKREALLEAKRNRPAPPGVGIDRRKRKL
jgi:hypothetical protein